MAPPVRPAPPAMACSSPWLCIRRYEDSLAVRAQALVAAHRRGRQPWKGPPTSHSSPSKESSLGGGRWDGPPSLPLSAAARSLNGGCPLLRGRHPRSQGHGAALCAAGAARTRARCGRAESRPAGRVREGDDARSRVRTGDRRHAVAGRLGPRRIPLSGVRRRRRHPARSGMCRPVLGMTASASRARYGGGGVDGR